MRRKKTAARIAAFILAMILVFNNEQVIYALAEGANPAGQSDNADNSALSGSEDSMPALGDEAGENGDNESEEGSQVTNPGEGGDGEGGSQITNPDEGGDGEGGSQITNPDEGGDGEGGSQITNPDEGGDGEGGSQITNPDGGGDGGENGSQGTAPDEGGNEGDDNNDDNECEHEWVTDPDTLLTVCSKCGTEKSDEGNGGEIPDEDGGEGDENNGNECEHEWVTDPDTLLTVCTRCGAEKTDGGSEEENPEEDECPEGSFHIYDLKEDGTGWVCVACGIEKEILDELDITLEMYIYAMDGEVSQLADDPDDRAYSKLPRTVEELAAYPSKELIIASLGDLLVVQDLSKLTDLEGYTIRISRRTIASSNIGQNRWELQGIADFEGLGSEEHPFKGTIESAYTNGSLVYYLDRPFFQYLSTDAVVREMSLIGTLKLNENKPKGILAEFLVRGESDISEIVTLSNVVIDGEVSNTDGAAGLVFGRVENQTKESVRLMFDQTALRLCQNGSITSSVSGIHAGGIAGEIVGNVVLEISDPGIMGNLTVRSATVWTNGDNESGALAWDNTAAGGMYVGAMNGGKAVIAGNTTPYAVNVQREGDLGGANGGFIGMALGTDVTTNASADAPVTVSGVGVTGRISGGILGYYDHSGGDANLQLDYISINAPVNAEGAGTYFAGGVLGRYYRNENGVFNGSYDTINHVSVTGGVSATYFAGGVVGVVHGSNLRIGGENAESILVACGVTNQSQAWGTENDPLGAGGVAGLVSGQYIEIQNAVVRANFHQNASAAGGIVGTVGKIKAGFNDNGRKSILKIQDVTVDSTFGVESENSPRFRGGVLGMVFPGSMVALDGTISVNMTVSNQQVKRGGRTGHIAGYQKEALIYFEENVVYARPKGKNWVDDIGNYGGVYRNGSWGEGESLISYEENKVRGTVGKSGSAWVIDSEADFIRLAVMLNSQGNFAADCFGNTDKAALLGADYSIIKSLNLEHSGIYSLNRNDSTGFNEQFTGKFVGTGSGTVTINLGELTTHQSYLALFLTAGNGAEISGFKLVRSVEGANLYAAGIVCRSLGTFTARDLDIRVGIKSFCDYDATNKYDETGQDLKNVNHYYAGLAAWVDSQGNTVFTAEKVKIGGKFDAAVNYDGLRMGSMIAEYVQSGTAPSTIRVEEFELMGDYHFTSQGRFVGGMITMLNNDANSYGDQTILSMENIKIHNGASMEHWRNDGSVMGGWLGRTWKNVMPDEKNFYSIKDLSIGDGGTAGEGPLLISNGPFGGLVDSVTGRIQLKNINIQNGIFNNRSSRDRIGLLFRLGHDALIEIDGYTIAGRKIGDGTGADNSGSVQVINCDGKNFDEIVAYNMGNYTDANNHNVNGYKNGGIVNIIYDGFSSDTSAGHAVYQNRLLASDNDRTRYYYNLFGSSFEKENSYLSDSGKLSGAGTVITNEKQMMIWHLSQYMNESVRRYLKPYYIDGNINARSQDTTFNGLIDLNKVSYYPTPVSGGTYTFGGGAKVKFYGKDITDKATAAMTPSSDKKEHYMMHAGLFISENEPGSITVKGADRDNFLTLTGSVTNLGSNSGALFVRSIRGEKKVYYVRLDSLYVAGYDPNVQGDNHEVGLLIGSVEDRVITNNVVSHEPAMVDLSWIETTGYNDFTGKAASALIGRVGDPEATKISVEFKNIKIDSRKDGIFQYASLIDKNYYREDMTENTSSADALRRLRYLYTEAAFKGEDKLNAVFPFDGSNTYYGSNQYESVGPYVTIGAELAEGKGIEFWDVEYGPMEGEGYGLPFIDGKFIWNESNVKNTYLPYVHTVHEGSKNIEVNPKNVSISEGCGTYEDPYIINNPKQLLALARYLQNRNDYKYLGGWQINAFESGRTGGSFCSGVHKPIEDPDTDLKTYPYDGGTLPDGFPTQEELSQAYYMITADIDLSSMSNATDRQIAEDFVGFGTEKMPFRGVITGAKSDYDGNGARYPRVTLPLRQNWTTGTYDVNHGFIQYAKGVVVKDLLIAGAEVLEGDTGRTGVAKISDMAGGVIGCVLGGDNIIDNVSVKLKVAVTGNGTQAGAYVGNVRQGSVILRNLSEVSAAEFSVGQWNAGGSGEKYKEFELRELENYPYVSGLIGKVEDGCIIYEDNFNSGGSYNKPVLAHEAVSIPGIYGNNMKLPVCKHYDIIVKSGLDAENSGNIKVSGNGSTGFTAKINTAAQLQIVSMAINSDAFSVYYNDGGYAEDAVCRKAGYSDVGNVNSSNSGAGSDFAAATGEDDKTYYYPYLYTYFDFSGVTGGREGTFIKTAAGGKTVYISQLNAATAEVKAVMNYELTNAAYDMSVYCRGFRGLGATYGMLKNETWQNRVNSDSVKPGSFYADFRANFNGNNAVINVAIDRTYDSSIHTAALFNDLLDRTAGEVYTIKNFTVTGSVTSVTKDTSGNVTTDGNAAYPDRTGAVVGLMRRPWKLENVAVKNMLIEARGHAGGIVAWIDPESGKAAADNMFDFERCRVEEGTRIYSYGGSAGGILGVMTQNDTRGAFNADLNLRGCTIAGTGSSKVEIEIKNRTADRNDGENGGLERNNQLAAGRSGGLAGYIGRRFLNNNNNAWHQNPSVQVTIENASDGTVSSAVYAKITGAYSTGGLIGGYDTVQSNNGSDVHSSVIIKSGKVENCVITGTRGNLMPDRDDYYDYGVGGLIGEMRGNSFKAGENGAIIISDTNIISSATAGNGMYAGGVAGCLKAGKSVIANVQVRGAVDSAAKTALELGGQQYTIQSRRADAGGVVGRTVGEGINDIPALTMKNIQVSGMSIMADEWGTDNSGNKIFKTSDAALGHAGGVIGTNEVQLEITGDGVAPGSKAVVESCMITTSGGNAGGIAGYLYKHTGSSPYVRSTVIQDVKIINNIIGYNNLNRFTGNNTEAGAGGVFGRIEKTRVDELISEADSMHRLENTLINGCWIYGPSAGGVLGCARNTIICSNKVESEPDVCVEVKENSIYGICVGGVIGSYYNSAVNYIGANISDNRLQAYRNDANNSSYAGGFCGYINYANNGSNSKIDYITIQKNHILAANLNGNKNISAGGFFGYANIRDSHIYQAKLVDNLTGYSECSSGGVIVTGSGGAAGSQTLQTLFNSTDGEISKDSREVFLVAGTGGNNYTTQAMPSVEELRQNGIGNYAGRIGNLVGSYGTSANTVYFLAPVISYNEADISTRPVTDVGMNTPLAAGAQESDVLLGAPYAYRNYIHVVYHDIAEPKDADAGIWNDVNGIDNSSVNNWQYLFDGISYQNIIENYRNTETTNSLSEYLNAYRLNVKADEQGELKIEEVYEKLYRDDTKLLTPLLINMGENKQLPAIALDTQYGTADQLVKGIVAALTGVGGTYSSDDSSNGAGYSATMAEITNIEVKPMQINADGTITTISGGQASLAATKKGTKWSVDYNDYDNDGLDGNPQTFTLLTITYSWKYRPYGQQEVERKEVVRIPVYVMVRLGIDTHLKIIEDLVYNADKVKEEGLYSSVTIANDSSYTLYAEYIYDSAREKYSDTRIEKKVGMTNAEGREVGFAKGTKLTLIDVSGGNKVYYYTVQDNDPGPYPYTAFVDEDGNHYVNKEIGKEEGFDIYGPDETYQTKDMGSDGKQETFIYSDAAVERFLITVDISGVKKEDRIETESRKFHISPVLSDNLENRTTLTEHTNLQAQIQPGMNISFYQKGRQEEEEKTWIEGNIKADEDGIVNIWAAIDIWAEALYWSAVAQDGANTIDSANSNKYLEIQTHLTTVDNQEIALPDGTNVFIKGERTQPVLSTRPGRIEETSLGVYNDTSNIYFYKDGSLRFSLNNLLDIILEDGAEHGISGGRIRWVDQLRLDFRNADMMPYDAEKYGVNLRLLRVENSEYPAAGEELDAWSQELPAARKYDLACAVEARDLMQLGINIYENQTSMPHDIDFDFKLDFSGILTGNNATDKSVTDKQYVAAYRIWEKTNTDGTPQYAPYTGDQLELELVNDPAGQSLSKTVSGHPSSNGISFWYVNYRFDYDEIKNGTEYQVTENGEEKEEQNEGVIVRSLKLTVNDAAQMDLSNYKIQVIVFPVDKPEDGAAVTVPSYADFNLNSQTSLSDFFVFTVANLKTDLDY